MASPITTKTVNHVALTVTDPNRSREFYTSLLGFQFVAEFGPKTLLSNGQVVLALAQAPEPSRINSSDSFDENRVGLDHLSFSVGSRQDLDNAARLFDERGVSHGEIKDLGEGLRLYVLAFRDPDNIQVELSAPYE